MLCNFKRTYIESESDQFRKAAASLGIDISFIKQTFPIDPFIVFRAMRLKNLRECNVVQTHGYKPNIIGFFLRALTHTPWIAFAHGYTNDDRRVRAYNRLDSFLFRYASIVVAVSNSMRKLLVQKGVKPSKIRVICNAVDESEIKPSILPAEMKRSLQIESIYPVIGVIGRLGPEKGHALFLKAFREVLSEFTHAKALIVGDGQEKERLLSFCAKENMVHHVVFTGHVENTANYYQIMDMIVIASYSEGLPNVLLEAMVLGIPVVATSVGGIPEVIKRNNGVLVPPGNPTRLAEEISDLLRDPGRMDLLGRMAQKSIGSLSDPNQRARKIAQIYRSLLHS